MLLDGTRSSLSQAHGPSLRVSLAEATGFLSDHFHGEATAPRRFAHGEWSAAYAFRRSGAGFVVRFSTLREDFEKDRLAARYASPALPIPKVAEVGEALGGFYAISERAAGGHIDELDGAAMRRVLPALFAAIDAERRADLGQSTGYGGWDAEGAAPHPTWRAALLDVANDRPTRRTHGWRERLAASPTGMDPFEQAFARLEELVRNVPEERHLVHSDLLHFNVLVSGNNITAVLDWGSSLYGDFLYDVAWLCFFQPWFPAWRGINFQAEAMRYWRSIGVELHGVEERLLCYQLHVGLDAQAYTAFTGRFAELEANALRTLELIEGRR